MGHRGPAFQGPCWHASSSPTPKAPSSASACAPFEPYDCSASTAPLIRPVARVAVVCWRESSGQQRSLQPAPDAVASRPSSASEHPPPAPTVGPSPPAGGGRASASAAACGDCSRIVELTGAELPLACRHEFHILCMNRSKDSTVARAGSRDLELVPVLPVHQMTTVDLLVISTPVRIHDLRQSMRQSLSGSEN